MNRVYEFRVYARVNPNAHSVRYGRDCRAPAIAVGTVFSSTIEGAVTAACEQGLTYNPEMGAYAWLLSRVTAVGPA